MSKRGRDGDLDVEELNVGAWGNPGGEWTRPVLDPPPAGPPSGPPTGPPRPPGGGWSTTGGPGAGGPPPAERARSWFRRHSNHVIAGVGAFALLVAVVAIASGPDGDPAAAPTTTPATVAPSSTRPGPVTTVAPSTTEARAPSSNGTGDDGDDAAEADEIDYRFALPAAPDGFEVTSAEEIQQTEEWPLPITPALFAADGSTWQSGPWLTIAGGDESTGGWFAMFPFTRPPIIYTIGDVEARTGGSVQGVEVTTLMRGGRRVEIAARGLDPLTTAAVAHALQWTDTGHTIPGAAIPAVLRSRSDLDVTPWAMGWAPGARATVSYQAVERPAWLGFGVRPLGAAPALSTSAPYFLTDLRYLVVRGGTGVAGTFEGGPNDPTHYVIWEIADREYVATATGIALDELISYAATVVQPGDPGWRADLWDEMQVDARNCCDARSGEVSEYVDTPIVSADGGWRAEAAAQGASVSWNFTESTTGDAFGVQSPLGAPVLQVGSRYGWAYIPDEFPAAAVALVDRSMVGAMLRLTTTGSQPQTVEVRLEPVEDDMLAPYLTAAAVLPWLDGGFVAQLIGPDGQTIAVQTDADLP